MTYGLNDLFLLPLPTPPHALQLNRICAEATVARDFLKNDYLPDLLAILATIGEIHGPALSEDGVMAFRPIKTAPDLRLGYHRTLIPPKKYLLPPRETTLTFTPSGGYRQPQSAGKNIVLFGLHPCDLLGIAYLDKVFLGDCPDPLYRERRNDLTLIGLSCTPDEFCFCGNLANEELYGCDLYLQKAAGGFHLTKGTPKGAMIFSKLASFLTQRDPTPIIAGECGIAGVIRRAAESGEAFPDSPLWDEFADRCLSCGACSICCPTCYCFDIREYGALDGETAIRLREWDNCLFKSHGEVAGGVNFRMSRQERFQYRYQHKYLGFGPTRGIVSCVGCGRCREVCPVQIDILELFKESGYDQQP